MIISEIAGACVVNPVICEGAASFGKGVVQGVTDGDSPPNGKPIDYVFEQIGIELGKQVNE